MLKVGDYQSGFKEGKSTASNLSKVLKEISKDGRRYSKPICLLLDLRKAYDSVIRSKLIEIL